MIITQSDRQEKNKLEYNLHLKTIMGFNEYDALSLIKLRYWTGNVEGAIDLTNEYINPIHKDAEYINLEYFLGKSELGNLYAIDKENGLLRNNDGVLEKCKDKTSLFHLSLLKRKHKKGKNKFNVIKKDGNIYYQEEKNEFLFLMYDKKGNILLNEIGLERYKKYLKEKKMEKMKKLYEYKSNGKTFYLDRENDLTYDFEGELI